MTAWLEQHRGPLLFISVVAILTGILLIQSLRRQPPPIILSTATPVPSPEPTPTPNPVRVYVSGAVVHPDVYTLAPDAIVKDALAAAGGPAPEADLDRINLAQPVWDGQQVHVLCIGETSLPAAGQRTVGGRVNINLADAATLEALPGIGPVMAQRIVEYRKSHGPFAQAEDIMNVSGIGPATFAEIEDLITTK